MSLSVKTVVLLFGVLSLGCITLVYHLNYSVAPAFEKIESEAAELHINRISNAVLRDLRGLTNVTEDWGHWDLTYDFISTENQEFIDSNLNDSTFLSLGIHGIVFFDKAGRTVWSGGYNFYSESRRPDFEVLLRDLPLDKLVYKGNEVGHRVQGFVATGEGPAMVAAVDITSSSETATPVGTLIFIRFLDSHYIEDLGDRVLSPLHSLDGSLELAASDGNQWNWIDGQARSQVRLDIEAADTLIGDLVIHGLDGNPVLGISTQLPRSAYISGKDAILSSVIITVLTALATLTGISLLLKVMIITPVTNLKTEIDEFRRTGEMPLEPAKVALDEIGVLTKSFRTMTHRLTDTLEEVKSQRERAEQANRAKSEFIANMSHELRTPLNAVLGFSEIMYRETLSPLDKAQVQEYARHIHDGGALLLGKINDILDLSEMHADMIKLNEEVVDVEQAISDCLGTISQKANDAGVTLDAQFGDDLPWIMADEKRLRQIVLKLLSNAIKFTPSGGTVTTFVEIDSDGYMVLSVADTGVGISVENLPNALSAFGQVDGSFSRRQDGTGLGLPIAKSLTELHGGSLSIDSEVDCGTTVSIRLPADRIVLDSQDSKRTASRA